MPALNQYYDPNGAAAASAARRDQAYAKLAELSQARQAFTDKIYGQQQAEQAKAKNLDLNRTANLNRSAMDEAAQGAAMGGLGGPWGALIGGGVGSIIGGIKGYGQRKKEGQSTGSALLHSIGDTLTFGLGSAGSQAAHGDYDSIQAGIPMFAGAAAMGGKAIGDHFANEKMTAMADGDRANKMAEYAQTGNALAEQDRFNRKYSGQNYITPDNPMSMTSQIYNQGVGQTDLYNPRKGYV